MPTSNQDNVPTNDATEKYRGAVGRPVQTDPPAFGASRGTVPNPTTSTEVQVGGRGNPVRNGN